MSRRSLPKLRRAIARARETNDVDALAAVVSELAEHVEALASGDPTERELADAELRYLRRKAERAALDAPPPVMIPISAVWKKPLDRFVEASAALRAAVEDVRCGRRPIGSLVLPAEAYDEASASLMRHAPAPKREEAGS
jgi:hypothetical protein